MKKTLSLAGAVATSALLGACGGGVSVASPPSTAPLLAPAPPGSAPAPAPGSTPTLTPAPVPVPVPTPAVTRAEGVYFGTASDGKGFVGVVLEDDQFFAFTGGSSLDLFGSSASGDVIVNTLIQGQGASSATNFDMAGGRRYAKELIGNASFEGTYTANASISGNVFAFGYPNISYSGSKPQVGTSWGYNYSTPADYGLLQGSYAGVGVVKDAQDTSALTFSSAGAVSGSFPFCNVSGTAVARASGKNIFDVSLTFVNKTSATPCPFANQLSRGIAIAYRLDPARFAFPNHLLLATTASDGSNTVLFSTAYNGTGPSSASVTAPAPAPAPVSPSGMP